MSVIKCYFNRFGYFLRIQFTLAPSSPLNIFFILCFYFLPVAWIFSSQDEPPASSQPPSPPHPATTAATTTTASTSAWAATSQTAAALHRAPSPPVQQSKNGRSRAVVAAAAPCQLPGHLRQHHHDVPRVTLATAAPSTASKVDGFQRNLRQHCDGGAICRRPA